MRPTKLKQRLRMPRGRLSRKKQKKKQEEKETTGLIAQHTFLSHSAPEDVANGDVPTAGEAVGQQTGVNVPNPHDYTGAIVGGGVAGTFVTLAIFCVATYMCYKW